MSQAELLDVDLLVDLAQGGVAESMTPDERSKLHISTDLDDYLAETVTQGHQVVLTGNPGDGKTQHLLIHRDEHASDLEDPFYLEDASRLSNEEIKSQWMEAYEADRPGIIAINDGPLREVIRKYGDEYGRSGGENYSVLDEVKHQLDNQIVYSDNVNPVSEDTDVTVIDLGNRSVLSSEIIGSCIQKLIDQFYDPSQATENHIAWNLSQISEDEVKSNLQEFIVNLSNLEPETHVTLRDVLRYLSYIVTAGEGRESPNETFDMEAGAAHEDYRYYKLAFAKEQGTVFSMIRRRFKLQRLTHPKIDAELWTRAKERADENQTTEELFESLKRQFIFDPEVHVEGYESSTLLSSVSDRFGQHLDDAEETAIGKIILRINQYFDPEIDPSGGDAVVHIWFSHKFGTKATKSLVSRHKYSRTRFERRHPRLNEEVSQAIDYDRDYYYLEYKPDADDVDVLVTRLRVDRKLFESLDGLDPGLPYALRDDDQERRLMRFMENINAQQMGGRERVTVRVKDTQTNRIKSITVDENKYVVE